MTEIGGNRLGNSGLMTEKMYKTLVSSTVCSIQRRTGHTDRDLADLIACEAATVGNARNMDSKLSGHTLFNLLAVYPFALEGLLNHYGRRSVPIEAKCNTDELVSTTAAVHKLAVSQSPSSKTPGITDDDECLDMEAEIDAALEALWALKQRCEKIRAARRAA